MAAGSEACERFGDDTESLCVPEASTLSSNNLLVGCNEEAEGVFLSDPPTFLSEDIIDSDESCRERQ